MNHVYHDSFLCGLLASLLIEVYNYLLSIASRIKQLII